MVIISTITAALLKKLRKEAGLTQEKLAQLAGVSQAHVAKIEQGKVDPRLSTVNRLIQVLNELKKKKCRDIMSHGVVCARLKDRILDISDKMVKNAISQIPVIDNNEVIGTVTEKSIMRRLGSGIIDKTAQSVLTSPLPLVNEETDVEKAKELLRTYQGVLVSRGKRIIGIITRSDLLKVICEPLQDAVATRR